MLGQICRTLIATTACLGLLLNCGCTTPEDVRFRIIYSGGGTQRVEDLSVIVGAHKESWGLLEPGTSISGRLSPDGEPSDVNVSFNFLGQDRQWRGPTLRTGYDIEIRIDADGSVTAKHCIRPCDLLQN